MFIDKTEAGGIATILLVTSEYHMPRANHLFRSFFNEKGIELTIEEHIAKDSEDIQLLLGERKRIDNLGEKYVKYQIPRLPDEIVEETRQKIEKLIFSQTNKSNN